MHLSEPILKFKKSYFSCLYCMRWNVEEYWMGGGVDWGGIRMEWNPSVLEGMVSADPAFRH